MVSGRVPSHFKRSIPTICKTSLSSMSSSTIINGTTRLNPAGGEDEDLDDYLLISNQKKKCYGH